jgi:hypothetical protein
MSAKLLVVIHWLVLSEECFSTWVEISTVTQLSGKSIPIILLSHHSLKALARVVRSYRLPTNLAIRCRGTFNSRQLTTCVSYRTSYHLFCKKFLSRPHQTRGCDKTALRLVSVCESHGT